MSGLQNILSSPPVAQPPKDWRAGITFDGENGEATSEPLSADAELDHDKILTDAGLDPELFEVSNLRFSIWDAQTKEGPEKFKAWKFNFRTKSQADADPLEGYDFDDAVDYVRQYKPLTRRTLGAGLGEPVTEVVNMADFQLFKSEGGGIDATLDRVLEGLDSEVTRIEDMRRRGVNIDEIILINNGDPIENIAGNYSSQLYTVQGGLRQQLTLALEIWTQFATTLGTDGRAGTVRVGPQQSRRVRSPGRLEEPDL